MNITEAELEIGRKAIEDILVERRNGFISILNQPHGFVIRFPNGTPSDVVRMSTIEGLRIAIKAIENHRLHQAIVPCDICPNGCDCDLLAEE